MCVPGMRVENVCTRDGVENVCTRDEGGECVYPG